jgi:LacI family repressor for deo operon, udp, cdd, tsx, nupC, and nupG
LAFFRQGLRYGCDVNNRLQEIAVYTKLSESTVSRVLNGKAGVATATRDAVLTAIDVLGYERPTQLRTQLTRLVGVVMPQFANPIFPAFAEAIGGYLTQRGFTPVFGVTESGGPSEAEYVDTLIDRQVAGIIFISGVHSVVGQDHHHYRKLIDRGLPVVAIDGLAPDLDLACVSTDDAEAVALAVRHLVHLGHTHLGLAISDEDHVPGARKQSAFLAFVAEQDILTGGVDRSMYSLEGGMSAATHLIEQGATAIICGSDLMALGAVKAARRLGLRVPDDISVVGFDDSTFMPLVEPAITTIRQPVEAMAKAAASMLVAQMTGRERRSGEVMFEPELVVRASTGPVPM